MKRPIEERMKSEYEKYKEACKKPKSYYQWATEFKNRTIASLLKQLDEWNSFHPKVRVVIKKVEKSNK